VNHGKLYLLNFTVYSYCHSNPGC